MSVASKSIVKRSGAPASSQTRRSCCRVSRPQHLQPLPVTGDPIDEPKRRRGRRDITEQRLLIAERPQVGQTVPTIGEHHRKVTNHAALIMPGPPLLEVGQLQRQRARQPGLLGDAGQQSAARMRHQPLSVRRDNYLEIAAITLHPQGDLLSTRTGPSASPILQAQPDIPAPRTTRGADR